MSLRALEIARTALITHRTEIEIIGHNIANVRTPGYARRRAYLAQVAPERMSAGNVSGLGVQIVTIQRMGDRLLAAQINVETGALGQSRALAETLREVETLVAGPSGRGLLDPLNALFDAFADIAADPGAETPRRQAVQVADAICDTFQRAHAALQTALGRNDQQLVTAVRQVNQLAAQVAAYNRAIGEAGGEDKALDLTERRDLVVNDLARLCGAATIHKDNGQVSVLIGGHHLVQDTEAAALELVPDSEHPWLNTVAFKGNVPPAGLSGEISGLLQARAEGITAVRAKLNAFAGRFADALNSIHSAGYGLDNTTGDDLFVYDASYPAATIALNPALAADPRRIAAASAPDQPGNGENALALEALRTIPPPGEPRSLLEEHTAFLAGIGVSLQLATARHDARESVVATLQARADALGGVALDEEAIRLHEAEKAYSAAAGAVKVALSLIDEVMKLVP